MGPFSSIGLSSVAGAKSGCTTAGVQKAFVGCVSDRRVYEVKNRMQRSPEVKLQTGIKKRSDQRHFQSPLGLVRYFLYPFHFFIVSSSFAFLITLKKKHLCIFGYAGSSMLLGLFSSCGVRVRVRVSLAMACLVVEHGL